MAPACTRDRDPSFRSSTTPSSPSPSWTEANLFIRSFLLRRPTRTPYFQGTLCKKAGWAGCLRRIATCSVFTLLDFPPRPRLTFSFRLRPTPTPGDPATTSFLRSSTTGQKRRGCLVWRPSPLEKSSPPPPFRRAFCKKANFSTNARSTKPRTAEATY